MKKIILASVSPWRRKILATTGIPFSVEESGYEENMKLKLMPRTLARHLALGKAQAVAVRHKHALVIGADTFVVFQDKLLGKPRTLKAAARMLKLLSGRTHTLLTGIAIVDSRTRHHITKAIGTRVTFRTLSGREIARYVKTGESLTVAGGYAIQGGAAGFVKRIAGDYHNIVGLPLASLIEELRRFGVK
jgi:septum formation protein